MKAWIVVLLLALCHAQKNGFCLLQWNDEFTGPTLDMTKWQYEVSCNGGGNGELQCYTPRSNNVFIEDGKLVLKVQKETYTGTQAGCTDTDGCTNTQPFTSGRVNTANSPIGSFLRGRMEVRAKLCSGKRLWPAIWMLPTTYAYGGWAASGEIDMMEQRGDKNNVVSGTLHHGGTWPNNVYTTTGEHTFPSDLSQDYHTYAVEWTEDSMKWFVDDNNFQTYALNKMWNSPTANPYTQPGQPWDQKFHFVLNVAVGGPTTGFFNGYPALTDADVAAWNVSDMRVDYVRVWRQGGDCDSIYTPAPSTDAKDLSSTTKMTIIIAASVGGFVFLAGIAGIVVAIVLLRRAKRRLNAAPTLSATSSQTHLTSWGNM